jgi:SAM-dependent methyltransferase
VKNPFSKSWYETFLDTIPDTTTDREIDFLTRNIPPDAYPLVLDLCCGPGRHTSRLALRGYAVHGVDIDEGSVRLARAAAPGARFDVLDMRSVGTLDGPYDAVVNLWHSFGFFDDETNRNVLRQVLDVLRPGGRAVFDLYNDRYCRHSPPTRITRRAGRNITTSHVWDGQRLRLSIAYDGVEGGVFEWRLYSEGEFARLCEDAGFEVLLACVWYDEARPITRDDTRMQFVLERPE